MKNLFTLNDHFPSEASDKFFVEKFIRNSPQFSNEQSSAEQEFLQGLEDFRLLSVQKPSKSKVTEKALELLKKSEAYYSFTPEGLLKKDLQEKIQTTNDANIIEIIAEMTLNLGKSWLHPLNLDSFGVQTYSDEVLRSISSETFPFCNELIKKLNEQIESEMFSKELKDLLILSLGYTSSKDDFLSKEKNSENIAKPLTKVLSKRILEDQILPSASSTAEQLLNIYKKRKANALHLNMPEETAYNNNDQILPELIEYTPDNKIHLTTWYDIAFLDILLSNSDDNPYYNPASASSKRFIQQFQGLEIQRFPEGTLLEFMNFNYRRQKKYSEHKVHLYNQFFAERIGSFNLINHLFEFEGHCHNYYDTTSEELTNSGKTLSTLAKFPLFKTRMRIIDCYHEFLKKYHHMAFYYIFPQVNKLLSDWINRSNVTISTVHAQIFRYLISLFLDGKRKNSKKLEDSVEEYLKNLDLNYFKLSPNSLESQYQLMPTKKAEGLGDKESQLHQLLSQAVYQSIIEEIKSPAGTISPDPTRNYGPPNRPTYTTENLNDENQKENSGIRARLVQK